METFFLSTARRSGSIAVVINGQWEPGIGDPSPMGWITAIAYAVAGVLCIWVAKRRPLGMAPPDARKHIMFWATLGMIMCFLTLNKQLDLQMWFWLTAKNLSKSYGFYEHRKTLQFASVIVITLLAGVGVGYFIWLTKSAINPDIFRKRLLALFGVAFILCFVVIRATSLHHVDLMLGWSLAGIKVNWILENGGILLVAVAAQRSLNISEGTSDAPS